MKKTIFTLLVCFLISSSTFGWRLCWKDTWDTPMPSYTVNSGTGQCDYSWGMTSHNWCTGKTTHETYTWSAPCNWPANQLPPDYPNRSDKGNAVDMMNELQLLGATVPPIYLDPINYDNDPSLVDDAIAYRLELAGYENTHLWPSPTVDPCFVPTPTLPILFPLCSCAFSLDLSCITVAPNPAITNLTIIFDDQYLLVSNVQLIELATGSMHFEKIGGILSTEIIPVGTFPSGIYQLVIYDNLGISQTVNVVIDPSSVE